MVTTAWAGAHGADVVCLLVDAKRGIDEEMAPSSNGLRRCGGRGAVLNKIDLVEKPTPARHWQGPERALCLGGDLHDLGANR